MSSDFIYQTHELNKVKADLLAARMTIKRINDYLDKLVLSPSHAVVRADLKRIISEK